MPDGFRNSPQNVVGRVAAITKGSNWHSDHFGLLTALSIQASIEMPPMKCWRSDCCPISCREKLSKIHMANFPCSHSVCKLRNPLNAPLSTLESKLSAKLISFKRTNWAKLSSPTSSMLFLSKERDSSELLRPDRAAKGNLVNWLFSKDSFLTLVLTKALELICEIPLLSNNLRRRKNRVGSIFPDSFQAALTSPGDWASTRIVRRESNECSFDSDPCKESK